MPLNFTGRAAPAADRPPAAGRTPGVMLACFAVAALLATLVVAVALRQQKVEHPSLAPPLVGADRPQALIAAAKLPPAPAPAVVRQAAQPAPTPAAPRAEAPARPDPAVARARMLAALRQVPHGTITLSVEDAAGAQAYARELTELFRQAGWTVDQASAFGTGAPRRGLAAALGVSPADEAVREAFDAVGFRFGSTPADAGVIRTPEIFVGVPYGARP
ncbi:MAG TPA: hypothetical protein VGM25_03925 [Caulobacteraceae bacterium]|jgi:hypothetical protein